MAQYSSSQIRNMLRQAQQRQKLAIDNYNRAVRHYNQNLRTAVNNYNREINAHYSRARANQQRVLAELRRWSSQPRTQLVVYQTSIETLYRSYEMLEGRAVGHGYGPSYDQILDLSERETANSLQVT